MEKDNLNELITGAVFVAISPSLAQIIPLFLDSIFKNEDLLKSVFTPLSYTISGILLIMGLVLIIFTIKGIPQKVNKNLSYALLLYTLGVIVFLFILVPTVFVFSFSVALLNLSFIIPAIGAIVSSIISAILSAYLLARFTKWMDSLPRKIKKLNKK